MIYVKESSAITYGILKGDTPETLQKLFTKISKNHNYERKMVANDNFLLIFLVWNYKGAHSPESAL